MLLVLWYQRVRTNGLVCLDLSRPEELDLLRRYGPFITNARVWAHGDRSRSMRRRIASTTYPATPTA